MTLHRTEVRPLLMVMNPRRIHRCMEAIDALEVDKVYLENMFEAELVDVVRDVVDRHYEYTHFVLLADDTVPSQKALDAVLALASWGHPVVTGYCNLDATEEGGALVNLTSKPFLIRDRSVAEDYAWIPRRDVEASLLPSVATFFTGAALTTMTREMWLRYPFGVNTHPGEPRGYCSDWNLCVRLQKDGIPILAARDGFVLHVKEDWRTQEITDPEKMLLVNVKPRAVRWALRGQLMRVERQPVRVVWPVPVPAPAAPKRAWWESEDET